jgi:Uri superfamily endonuclease
MKGSNPVWKVSRAEALPAAAGSYILVLHLARSARLKVGALGIFDFRAGWYLYTGSALGPGGLAARAGRHLRGGARVRWHVDYLRDKADALEVWVALGRRRRECAWARRIARLPGARAVAPGFGASDCACEAHLFLVRGRPAPEDLRALR